MSKNLDDRIYQENSIFNDKKILITGHTGFKGSWLSAWLYSLGARVIGVSDKVPTNPSHYRSMRDFFFKDFRIDIRDEDSISKVINNIKPDFIFHLAAQPIVMDSYKEPLDTFSINVLGTANILEALRKSNHKCTAIMVTSDKCYDNVEWAYGYRETDRLGGKDPYSGSKGAAELIIKSYVYSFFKQEGSNVKVGVGRAGNVIGGGDWASDRIVPDCIRAWSEQNDVKIRQPNATRPWQHVLEPLSGYLTLACKLYNSSKLNGEQFNFGPNSSKNYTVGEVVENLTNYWPGSNWEDLSNKTGKVYEASLLKLNCDKALLELEWQPTLDFYETVSWTANWYFSYYNDKNNNILDLTINQINYYINLAKSRKTFCMV